MTLTSRVLSALLPVVTGLWLGACSPESAPDPSGQKLVVTATTAMIGDVVKRIAGDAVTVDVLMGEGVDPHLYKPTVVDVKRLQAADLVLYNGLMLEGKMADVLARLGQGGKPVHAVAEESLEDPAFPLPGDDGRHDPHVWMDVSAWMRVAGAIGNALAEVDPERAEAYEARLGEYLVELERLDAYAREALASIPADRRVLVTAHDAFGYLARAYGLEVRGIQGISTESEAGLREIEDLVELLVTRKIPAVFVETSVSRKNVQALIEGAKARRHMVEIGGELFSDAMGASGTYEGTYIGMIDHNVTTITRALGGTAPEKGWNGNLP